MTPITCIIVDDEPLAVKLLESFVAKTPQLQLLASFTDSVEALSFLRDHPVQLAFMDIQMPDMNGMELSHMLPERTKVIFTTAFKVIAAVEKAEQWFSHQKETPSTPKTMFIRVDGELRQINFDNILFVEGMKDYVRFHVEGERLPLTTHMTMKAVEDALPAEDFMRINRSYIVRLDKIRTVDRNLCAYIGNEIIRVTEAYREAFERYCSNAS